MREYLTFTCVLVCNSLILWVVYFMTSVGFSSFDVPPTSGDLKAIYLPLTAFGYVAQVAASVCLFALLNWQVSKAFRHPHPLKILLREHRFYWFYFLMSYCVFVFANKIDWTFRLVFGGDRYGYYTTRPATSSFIIALSCLGLIYASLWQTNGLSVAKKATLSCAIVVFATAAVAFLHVSGTII